MKVALNATCFNDRPSGAKQRFLGIYRELATRLPQVEFTIFESADCRMDQWFSGIQNIQTRPTPITSEGRVGKLLHASHFWSKTLARERFDLFEAFHLPLPQASTAKTILTVHDIRYLTSNCNWPRRIAFHYAFIRALRNTDMVVTVSETMKQGIRPYCGNIPISVIPNGLRTIGSESLPDKVLQEFRGKFELPKNFLLAVGHLERRKNYLKLIDAIAYLRDAGLLCHLVIIGNDSGDRAVLEARISVLKLNDKITLLSGLSDLEVRCAYALCRLFVFPSTYEGFGIPILEAMAAAKPMVLANIPVFREITEGRGAYFSPSDPQDIANTIKRVLLSPQEQARLIQYGRKRVLAYDYSNIVSRYEQLYNSMLGMGSHRL